MDLPASVYKTASGPHILGAVEAAHMFHANDLVAVVRQLIVRSTNMDDGANPDLNFLPRSSTVNGLPMTELPLRYAVNERYAF